MLKNQERTAVVTAHLMDVEFDSGVLLHQEQVTIFPGETYGLLGARLSQQVSLFPDRIYQLLSGKIAGKKIDHSKKALRRPTIEEITIDWSNQSAEEIEALVNACNPVYTGAISYFRGGIVRILEVSPADVNNASLLGPGTIVHADAQNGIFVLCSDYRFLRINILSTTESILTGNKMAALGIKANEKFTSTPTNHQATSKISLV